MVEGGMTCVKYLLFAFNLIFFLFGATLIGVGAYVQIELAKYFDFFPTGTDVSATAILIIAVGALTLIIGFFGCCGAIRENNCMVMTFAVLIAIILICEIGGGIAAFVLRGKVEGYLRDGMEKTMQNYNKSTGVTATWDSIQKDLKCCGVNGSLDWTDAHKKIPDSCYDQDGKLFDKGCFNEIEQRVRSNVGIVAGVAIGLGVVELLGIIFACCLGRAIRRESQYA